MTETEAEAVTETETDSENVIGGLWFRLIMELGFRLERLRLRLRSCSDT